MSGSTIGGVIGGAIGFVVGGPAGAQVGWVVGSAVGGYVDPTQVFGPRLQDVRGQTSSVGGAIPRAWGTAPVPGNIIWQQPGVTEHRHKDDGKGSGQEQVTYTYTRSYAIMFHLGEIAGVLQIKRNGKIVYDARDDETIEAEYAASGIFIADVVARLRALRAENAKWISKATIYNGTQTQNPDPTIESYEGVGNVPSYRGRAYMVVTDDETQAGEIAQYEVVIAACGTSSTSAATGARWISTYQVTGGDTLKISPNAFDWDSSPFNAPGWSPGIGTSSAKHGSEILFFFNGTSLYSPDFGQTRYVNSTGLGSSGLGAVWLGGYWHVANVGGTFRSADGLTFTTDGPATDALGKVGSRLVGIRHAGDPGEIRISDDAGDTWTDIGFLPLAFNPSAQTRLADDGGTTLALICVENGDFGGTVAIDRRAHILYTTDGGVSWNEASNPFPDAIDTTVTTYIHHAHTIGLWVVVFHDRIAYGPSIISLTLSPHIFPEAPTHVDSDAGVIVTCGSNGMIQTSPDGDEWEAQSFGSTSNIFAVMSLYDPASFSPIPDAPAFYVDQDGNVTGPPSTVITPCSTTTVGDIVQDVCELSGLVPNEIDVSQLTDTLEGYVIARETDAASVIESLRPVGTFDPAEWDKKFRGIKRGGTAVGSINGDDLVERDGDAFEREIVQEVELLRKVSIGYLDTQASWAPNTQAWERLAGTINARGESVIEVSAVLGADQAATIAKRKGLVSWGEPQKQKFSLPYRLAKYTPTDILNYTDADTGVSQIRLMQIDDDSGVRHTEAADNRAEAYSATATGVSPKPPTITSDSLRGPTTLVVMDLPLWRSGDPDDLGLYMAGAGVLGGWTGAQVDVSLDGGVTYVQSEQITQESVIGYTVTSLTAWASSENPEDQSVTVWLPSAPSSVTYEVMLTYSNRAAVQLDTGNWEILQYQTVTALGDDLYTLSGLVRGRFNTTPDVITAGADFVLLDNTVQFVTTSRDTLGETLTVRATSYGTSSDAAVPFDFDFDDGFSQTEWPVHNVEATRDSAGDILVSCIIRDRLGTEVTRFPSVHFAGLRFTYTDGVGSFSYDVSNITIGTSSFGTHEYTFAQQIADFGSIPSGGLTVTIAPLNDITGAGPSSAGVSV